MIASRNWRPLQQPAAQCHPIAATVAVIVGRDEHYQESASPTATLMDTAAFIAHIVSQTKQNVQFLITHNQISANEGRDILAKLPSIPSTTLDPVQNLTQQAQGLMITPPPSSAATSNAPSLPTTPNFYPSPSSPSYIAPAKPIVQARAIWSYNEHGQVSHNIAT